MTFPEALGLLGLPPRPLPTEDEVKAAFRRQAKVHHPDAGGQAEAFRQLKAAQDLVLAQLARPRENSHPLMDALQWCIYPVEVSFSLEINFAELEELKKRYREKAEREARRVEKQARDGRQAAHAPHPAD